MHHHGSSAFQPELRGDSLRDRLVPAPGAGESSAPSAAARPPQGSDPGCPWPWGCSQLAEALCALTSQAGKWGHGSSYGPEASLTLPGAAQPWPPSPDEDLTHHLSRCGHWHVELEEPVRPPVPAGSRRGEGQGPGQRELQEEEGTLARGPFHRTRLPGLPGPRAFQAQTEPPDPPLPPLKAQVGCAVTKGARAARAPAHPTQRPGCECPPRPRTHGERQGPGPSSLLRDAVRGPGFPCVWPGSPV